jgi:hypothetical protein
VTGVQTCALPIYLAAIPVRRRQHHTCSACRRFVDAYGGLVTVGANGALVSPFWFEDRAPLDVRAAVKAIRKLVESARITGVWYSTAPVWGQPVTGAWHHLAVAVSGVRPIFHARDSKHGAFPTMAAKREDYRLLQEGLHEYRDVLTTAASILRAGVLDRSEKVAAQAAWLQDVEARLTAAPKALRANVAWRVVATAPAGFAHLSSTVFGSLLDDLKAGLPAQEAAEKFNAKLRPDRYQRPQAAPRLGSIKRAEELVAELGLAPSLERRFARLDDLRCHLWVEPPSPPAQAGGVFDHLRADRARRENDTVTVPQARTWEKFAREVLPEAARIELLAPSLGSFGALVTAAQSNAPPILQWDTPNHRNPLSWYVYTGGSRPSDWGLQAGAWVRVVCIVPCPAHWDDPEKNAHHGRSAMLVLDGAKDARNSGLALFPEIIKGELREVRSVIEAHSGRLALSGREEANAGMYMLGDKMQPITVKVWRGAGPIEIHAIDRWS